MNRSAASSSSAVVTPGRAFLRRISWQRASTRPAAAIFSISSGVLRWITARARASRRFVASVARIRSCTSSGERRAVEAAQQVLALVPVDQRLGLLVVDREALAHGLGLVVVALDQPRAVLVADALVLRRVELHVVDVLALRAGAPAGQPPDHLVVGRLDQEHRGELAAAAVEQARRASRPGRPCAGSRRAGSRRRPRPSRTAPRSPRRSARPARGRRSPCTPWPSCRARTRASTASRRMIPVE